MKIQPNFPTPKLKIDRKSFCQKTLKFRFDFRNSPSGRYELFDGVTLVWLFGCVAQQHFRQTLPEDEEDEDQLQTPSAEDYEVVFRHKSKPWRERPQAASPEDWTVQKGFTSMLLNLYLKYIIMCTHRLDWPALLGLVQARKKTRN